MSTEWIATSWKRADQFADMDSDAVEIDRVNSSLYKGERFAVRRSIACLSKDGRWQYEPLPSSRNLDFYHQFRFRTFKAAVAAANKAIEDRR